MALMLDALNIEPAMRILEIGTGTGYNAALLTALTGDPHLVTSIDIDALAIEQAQKALKDVVGEGITVVQGDGSQGYRENAPYDRIIVTASTTTVPWAWVEQLASNGLLVCVLQPHYAMLGGILRVEKQGESLRGRVLNTASFMALRGTTYPKRKIQISFSAPVIESFHFEPAFFHPQLLREDVHFAFFLYSLLPDLYVFQRRQENMMVFYQEATPQGYLVFRSSVVELRGEPSCARKLWSRLVRLYSFWLHCGEPKITQYHFSMEASSNQALSLTTPNGIIWPFTEENQR
jgi:protein-L-isoaspartate O-methyltransferase